MQVGHLIRNPNYRLIEVSQGFIQSHSFGYAAAASAATAGYNDAGHQHA